MPVEPVLPRRFSSVGGLVLFVVPLGFSFACSGYSGPTTPTVPIERLISITGQLNFNDVDVGSSSDRTITVKNGGIAALAVTGVTIDSASNFTVSWTSGSIAPGGSQAVTVRFTPTEPRKYDTTLRFNGNHTSGDNTLAVLARGVLPTDNPWDY